MMVGYPCINRSVGCTANSTFRLANYSEENLVTTVKNNLDCLQRILEYNAGKGLLFFRISSDIIPFASHPVNTFDWAKHFKSEFRKIGRYVRQQDMRISMHPDQFVLINALDRGIVKRSVAELVYHAKVLDALRLDTTAKIQIHVGGMYGDKDRAIERFVSEYRRLPRTVSRRLVIENDDRLYSLADCMAVHTKTGIPVLFDTFHHSVLNQGEGLHEALRMARSTWKRKDGVVMVDYSSQATGKRAGKHIEHINIRDLKRFAKGLQTDCDIMLEIKDKERSAAKALNALKELGKL